MKLTVCTSVKTLPESISDGVRTTIVSLSNTFIPEELSLDTFNSQYLQRNSTSPAAILASSKVQYRLDAPINEVEDNIFNVISKAVHADVKVPLRIIYYCNSPLK